MLLRLEIPSGICAKLRTVAASNNRVHMLWSLYYCLFAPHICMVLFFTHIPFVVNHTFNATSPERLQQQNRKACWQFVTRCVVMVKNGFLVSETCQHTTSSQSFSNSTQWFLDLPNSTASSGWRSRSMLIIGGRILLKCGTPCVISFKSNRMSNNSISRSIVGWSVKQSEMPRSCCCCCNDMRLLWVQC